MLREEWIVVPITCYIYYGTVYDNQAICDRNTSLFVFSQPPVKGQKITLEATGEQVILTDVNHYRMTIEAVPAEDVFFTPQSVSG
ncbi:hypothetical protein [Leptolyngbya ohadii]|uniref:hypothetical protein n=1 Tax=Leptolyngbya ohadii TaxID=1962290 RepID=UPI000B599907|nr:hypothetical protein [Leptolyngbya ohadii]